MIEEDQEGWNTYRKLVLSQFERILKDLDTLSDKVDTISLSVRELQVKAGMWGLIGGMVVSGIINFLFEKK